MNTIKYHIYDMAEPTQVKSAQRVLEVIEFFADWRRPASVNEICQALGYPQSSTSVLMKSLKESGYFDHDARTGMYVPSVRLAVATSWIQAQMFSEQSLLRLMESIHSQCGHTVMIGEQHGVHLRYLHVLQATREQRFTARNGALRPLLRSASGKMILTTKPEREVAQILRKANALESDAQYRVNFEALYCELETIRTEGHALSLGTSEAGAAAIAILLPVPAGHAPMTISLGGPIKEIKKARKKLVALLHESVSGFRKAVTDGHFQP